jgi:hypothetical protein
VQRKVAVGTRPGSGDEDSLGYPRDPIPPPYPETKTIHEAFDLDFLTTVVHVMRYYAYQDLDININDTRWLIYLLSGLQRHPV